MFYKLNKSKNKNKNNGTRHIRVIPSLRKQHKSRDAETERKYQHLRPISDLPRISNIFGYGYDLRF